MLKLLLPPTPPPIKTADEARDVDADKGYIGIPTLQNSVFLETVFLAYDNLQTIWVWNAQAIVKFNPLSAIFKAHRN